VEGWRGRGKGRSSAGGGWTRGSRCFEDETRLRIVGLTFEAKSLGRTFAVEFVTMDFLFGTKN